MHCHVDRSLQPNANHAAGFFKHSLILCFVSRERRNVRDPSLTLRMTVRKINALCRYWSRFRLASRTNRSAYEIVFKFPHWTGEFATFSEYVVECVYEHVDFFFANDERRQNFQHIHAMTGYLRQNTVLAQHLGHDHLSKEDLVDLVQQLPSHLELELGGFMKLNAHHETFATHFLDKGMLRFQAFDSSHERGAHPG